MRRRGESSTSVGATLFVGCASSHDSLNPVGTLILRATFAFLVGCAVHTISLASEAESACPPEPATATTAQSLAAMQDCMTRSPAPWPDAWQQEYIETIRQAIAPDPNTSQYARRLQILRDSFPLYWTAQKFTPDRSHFEVRQAQIRWYVENLMEANLPGEEGTARLRRQYEDLGEHAAAGLLAQFSFLDPNMIQKAKADYLAECRRNIDVPLLPIFLMPFSGIQIDQMKNHWHDLRYARVDLWRQLGGVSKISAENRGTASIRTHPDYLLARRSLDQWQSHVWTLTATAPEYYRTAMANDLKAQKQRLEATSRARRQESRIDNAALQTEYLSFLLAALLETAQEDISKPAEGQGLAKPGR